MRRISDEDGINAGVRNIGRYFLFAIPAALGGAACLWIAAASGWIDLSHKITMEDRALNAVGISEPPTEPIKIVTTNGTCLHATGAYLDGDEVVVSLQNTCDRQLDEPVYVYRTKAGDGTVLLSARYAFSGERWWNPKEKRERRIWIDGKEHDKIDFRTEVIEIALLN